ncbi:MAG: hypothetical protein ACREMF_02055 [Gemmatimonadales bacterium]
MASLCLLPACAPTTRYRMPESVRSYTILVSFSDSLSEQLARALRDRGLTVQRRVRGGAGPTAALVHFRTREAGFGAETWLHVRLADTRTGVIVAAATVVLDSLPTTPTERAELLLDSLFPSRRLPVEP